MKEVPVHPSATLRVVLLACTLATLTLSGCYVYNPPAAPIDPAPPRFVVGPYPTGQFVRELPHGYKVYPRRGVHFYYHRGVYYKKAPGGFVVVTPPF